MPMFSRIWNMHTTYCGVGTTARGKFSPPSSLCRGKAPSYLPSPSRLFAQPHPFHSSRGCGTTILCTCVRPVKIYRFLQYCSPRASALGSLALGLREPQVHDVMLKPEHVLPSEYANRTPRWTRHPLSPSARCIKATPDWTHSFSINKPFSSLQLLHSLNLIRSLAPSTLPLFTSQHPTMFSRIITSVYCALSLSILATAMPSGNGRHPTTTVTFTAPAPTHTASSCNTGPVQCCDELRSVSVTFLPWAPTH